MRKKRIDLDTTESSHKGLKGLLEGLLRRFKALTHIIIMMPVYVAACIVLGICIIPGVSLFRFVSGLTASQPAWVQNIGYAFSVSTGFFLYGFSMIFLTPALNFLIRGKLKEWRGPYYSLETLKWY